MVDAVDTIGCPHAKTVPDGGMDIHADSSMTHDTQILKQVPFSHTCKTNKDFLIDKEAATEEVIIDCRQKRLRHQVQQSDVDASQTQKVGNTRITIENVDGEMKDQIRFVRCLITCLQFLILLKVVKMGHLLQNFKCAIIQNRDPNEPTPARGRPCCGEIRWYGATDTGIRNVCSNVRLWGMQFEITLHAELSNMPEHSSKSVDALINDDTIPALPHMLCNTIA